jgi:Transglutaminase-like superfamily
LNKLSIHSIRLLLCISQFSFTLASAQSKVEKNIVLEQKSEIYSIELSKKESKVVIKKKMSELYRCNETNERITLAEFYDDNSSIDKIEFYVNGKRERNYYPSYGYYEVDGIFYSDSRICRYPLVLNKVGDKQEIRLEKTYRDPKYFTSVYFDEPFFTENSTFSFVIPKWAKVELKEYNFEGYDIKKSKSYDDKADADVITYTCKNIPTKESDKYSPGPSYFKPHILFMFKSATLEDGKVNYFNTLQDQYKWYASLAKEIGNDEKLMKEKAIEIIGKASTDIEKIKKIFYWVQHNIRYIAFEDGIAGFKPAKAQDTYNKKYGDCKAMGNLTKCLLKGLGFDARLCWIGTNHIAYDYSTPSLSVDNHMICALFYNGKTYFLDGTETNIGFNEYAERIQNRQVLIEDGSKYILERVPAVTFEQNLDKEKSTISIVNNSNLIGTREHTKKGEARSSFLSSLQELKKDNLQKAIETYFSEDNQDFEIKNMHYNDFEGKDSLFSLKYDYNYKNGVSSFGKELYLDMDFRKDFDNFIIDSTRKQDFMLYFKTNIDQETELTIPQGYKVSATPSPLVEEHPNIKVKIEYKVSGNKLVYKKVVIIKDIRIKEKDIMSWNKIMQNLTEKHKEQVVLIGK